MKTTQKMRRCSIEGCVIYYPKSMWLNAHLNRHSMTDFMSTCAERMTFSDKVTKPLGFDDYGFPSKEFSLQP